MSDQELVYIHRELLEAAEKHSRGHWTAVSSSLDTARLLNRIQALKQAQQPLEDLLMHLQDHYHEVDVENVVLARIDCHLLLWQYHDQFENRDPDPNVESARQEKNSHHRWHVDELQRQLDGGQDGAGGLTFDIYGSNRNAMFSKLSKFVEKELEKTPKRREVQSWVDGVARAGAAAPDA